MYPHFHLIQQHSIPGYWNKKTVTRKGNGFAIFL